MVITAETPVRDIVVETPTAIPVLEKLGIDYCCGGTHTLAEACTRRDRNVASVLDELERQQQNPCLQAVDWRTIPIGELIDYIVQNHHAFTRLQLDLISGLATKVERRHGTTHPEIYKLNQALAAINAELTHHFSCEEDVLFPCIAQLEKSQEPLTPAFFGSVQVPVTRMMMDHNHTGDELGVLREITNDYQPPADACTTYRALYRSLEYLERDLHQHIHLENNILFPRALKLETERV
jgi:regulator of cell morphogenesis and NO signaling